MAFRTTVSLCVIADVFWGLKRFYVICMVAAFESRVLVFKTMSARISEEVKKAWPKKGGRVRCLFGADKYEGVVESCSNSKGTCKVKFGTQVDTVNLKHPKWGVILEKKKKVIVFPYCVACASPMNTLSMNVHAYACEF